MSVHSYPRARDPYYQKSIGIGATTDTTVSVFVGKSPIKYFNPSSAYYDGHTGDMKLTLGTNYALTGQTLKTPTAATYTPTTGMIDFTVNGHGLTLGDKIRIQDRSLIFTCDKDLRQTEHLYPRSTDPAYNTDLNILEATDNYFTVGVGTGGGVAGALAGGALGAKAGAAIGGTIGAFFAGVGAVPGAAIGGALGGII